MIDLPTPKEEDLTPAGSIHFTLGEGLQDIFRQAYWFEHRTKWALETLGCFEGITEQQKMDVLNGDAQLIPTDDGTQMNLVYQSDFQFKARLATHKKFLEAEKIKIGGRYIDIKTFGEYLNNLKKIEVWKNRLNKFDKNDEFDVDALEHDNNFYLRMISIHQKMNNALYYQILWQAGFNPERRRNAMTTTDREDLQHFEDMLKIRTIEEIRRKRDSYKPIAAPKQEPIEPQKLIEGNIIFTDLRIIKEGITPPDYIEKGIPTSDPHTTYQRAVYQVFERAVNFVEQFKDELHPESFVYSFVQRKLINLRLIKEECTWSIIDEAEAAVHAIIDPKRYHGRHIWKEEDKSRKPH